MGKKKGFVLEEEEAERMVEELKEPVLPRLLVEEVEANGVLVLEGMTWETPARLMMRRTQSSRSGVLLAAKLVL